MGSLLKSPKPPSLPTITSTPSLIPSEETASEAPTQSKQQPDARKQSLLRRSRGRLGTIETSFNGFLSPQKDSNASPRKTLLGE